MNTEFVRRLLVDESFAYGFTIAFWGSGLLLIKEYGLLGTPGIFAYAIGAITGFGVLASITFGGPVDRVEMEQSPAYVLLAAIHYLACLVPIGVTHVLVAASLRKAVTLFLTGASVSVLYNVVAVLEEWLSESFTTLQD